MNSSSIVVNGKGFSRDQIVNNSFDTVSSFEMSTLNFCRDWLMGKDQFTIQTSGSTGAPKKISFSRDQMIASARMTQAALGLEEGETALVCLDTKYIAGQMMLVRSLVIGLNIIAVSPSANPFESIDTNQKVDFIALVPYQLQAILDESPNRLDTVRIAIIGGAPVAASLRERLTAVKCAIYATYGMTETLTHIGLMQLNGDNSQDYFTTLPDVEIQKDDRGCLIIRTSFLTGPITTNDLVELNLPNEFKWLGRWDNVINTGGVKVIPEKIEKQIEGIFRSLNITPRFFIAGRPDLHLGLKISLVIEGKPFNEDVQRHLQSEMKRLLDKYEIPKEIKFLEKFVQTETGKINRPKTIHLFPA